LALGLSQLPGSTVWKLLPDSLRDPDVESERFRQDLKTHFYTDMSALEVSLFHYTAIYISASFTYLLEKYLYLTVIKQLEQILTHQPLSNIIGPEFFHVRRILAVSVETAATQQ